tara:strand:+ start:614 stop:1126 length:513 start_codon:yes stop_codon:yes gene_type:complete
MAEDMQSNPDYQLVMTFLRNITPGDMSPEAANQLIAIGQRIQGGGVLSDREREMFTAVVGNISARNQVSIGGMSEGEMNLAMDTAMPSNLSPEDMDRFMAQKNAAINQMPSLDGETYGPSSGVSIDPNVMDMQQMIDAGIINPQRPQMRPSAAPMTSPPPPMRPQNLGGR